MSRGFDDGSSSFQTSRLKRDEFYDTLVEGQILFDVFLCDRRGEDAAGKVPRLLISRVSFLLVKPLDFGKRRPHLHNMADEQKQASDGGSETQDTAGVPDGGIVITEDDVELVRSHFPSLIFVFLNPATPLRCPYPMASIRSVSSSFSGDR